MEDLHDVLLGYRAEAINAVMERWTELEVLLVRAFHVHNVDRVVVRLKVFVRLVLLVGVFVQRVDEREVSCLSTFVLFEVARSGFFLLFLVVFVLGVTDMVELFCKTQLEDLY